MQMQITIEELKKLPLWVNWKYQSRDGIKKTKVPINAKTGGNARSDTPETWCNYQLADWKKKKNGCDGVGVMFSSLGNGYMLCGVDIDNHANTVGGNPLQPEILELFSGTYAEKSPSGNGCHILFMLPESYVEQLKGVWTKYHNKKSEEDIECYISGITNRYFTYTGDCIADYPITDMSAALQTFLDKYMLREQPQPQAQSKPVSPVPAPAVLDIAAMLDIARNSKSGAAFCGLYDGGDTSAYNGDDSSADLALCQMLAFYLQGDYNKIDTAFRSSALMRDKWEREDYRSATINKAINSCNKFYTPPTPKKNTYTEGRGRDGKKKLPPLDLDGFREWIKGRYELSFDAVRHETDFGKIENKGHEYFKALNFPTYLEQELQRDFSTGINISAIERYLNVIVGENVKNPLLDSIKAVKWDGVKRLQQVFDILHIEDNLSKIFLYKWFLQAIAMLHNGDNGKKFAPEFVLVLQGRQGTGKTRFFQHLCPQNYWGEGETVDPRDKDTLIRITSKWIVEIGEIGSTMKKDVDILKAFLTRGTDDCRPPYGKKSMEYPRKTVFVATVNETEFLLDTTGNRRWAVIPLDPALRIDYASQIKPFDTMQFWAEIYHYMQEIISKGGTIDGCFRFTEQERQALEQRNAAHTKPMKGEIEVLDVISKNTIVDDSKYKVEWRNVSVTQFKDDNFEVLGKYSAAEIAKVLEKHGYISKIVRQGNSTAKVRTLPYRVCINQYQYTPDTN